MYYIYEPCKSDMPHALRKLTSLFFVFVLSLNPTLVKAQFSDDFTDEEITSNPMWQGTISTFTVNSDSVLQLNDVTAGSSNISTGFCRIFFGRCRMAILDQAIVQWFGQ